MKHEFDITGCLNNSYFQQSKLESLNMYTLKVTCIKLQFLICICTCMYMYVHVCTYKELHIIHELRMHIVMGFWNLGKLTLHYMYTFIHTCSLHSIVHFSVLIVIVILDNEFSHISWNS